MEARLGRVQIPELEARGMEEAWFRHIGPITGKTIVDIGGRAARVAVNKQIPQSLGEVVAESAWGADFTDGEAFLGIAYLVQLDPDVRDLQNGPSATVIFGTNMDQDKSCTLILAQASPAKLDEIERDLKEQFQIEPFNNNQMRSMGRIPLQVSVYKV